jgi:hypothetical protein
MSSASRFRINAPEVVAETIEDEVIVIHLKTGTYYSLRKSAAAVWQLIEAGATVEESATAIESRYEGDPELIARSVAELVEQLVSEGLVVPGDPPAEASPLPVNGGGNGSREPFELPRLEPYIDMQALIQLDPVHETDDRGWPSAAKQ